MTRSFEVHFEHSLLDHERSVRSLNRASWAVIAVLAFIAVAIGVSPFLRAAGHLRAARLLAIGFLLCFFGLIALVVLLRRRLAGEIDRAAKHLEVLSKQNARLMDQTDVLERQSAELQEHAADLEQLTRRLSEAQHVAALGYWEIDEATGEVFWSDEMYRLCRVDPATQPPPTELFLSSLHPDDQPRMREVVSRALRELTEFTEQYRVMGPGDTLRTIQASARVIVDGQGRRKLVGTVQDVTARTQLELQLRQSQKMEAIGRLAGGVAHDFNNVLAVIEAYAGLLLAEASASDDQRAWVEQIRESSRSAAALTRQLLAFSRQQVLQPRVLDLNESIK